MRKLLLLAAAVAAAGLVVVAAGAATYRSIDPVFFGHIAGCEDLGLTSTTEAKFVSPGNGATDGRVHLLIGPTSVGWYVLQNEDVEAVIVRGGVGPANVYRYPEGHFSDGGLTTPLQKGKPAALGYVTVCYTP
jgi:hypothetical protein